MPGFPNMFLLYGPNTNGGTGSVVYTIECGMGHVLAALRELDRARRGPDRGQPRGRRELRPRAARAPWPKTVWHSGCTNWYVDENGNDPSHWPWVWSAYRRRTDELAPGAYELSRGEAPVTSGALG